MEGGEGAGTDTEDPVDSSTADPLDFEVIGGVILKAVRSFLLELGLGLGLELGLGLGLGIGLGLGFGLGLRVDAGETVLPPAALGGGRTHHRSMHFMELFVFLFPLNPRVLE